MAITLDARPAPSTSGQSTRTIPYVLAAAAFTLYAVWSLVRHAGFQTTGFDLGIFEQAVRSYAGGRWPVADLIAPGYPLLGDHFHPILAILAPLYRIWPAPETLLLAQQALLALSIIPVVRYAVSVLGRRNGVLMGIGYALSFGVLCTVTFDFHEVCFAVPLLAFSAERLLRGDWGIAVAFAAPLVLIKEDLPLTLVAIGAYLAWRGQRVLGWLTAAAGVLVTSVLVLLVLPALNSGGDYAFDDRMHPAPFDGLWLKLATLVVLFAPTAFAALRSPLVILVLPTLAWRFFVDFPRYWSPGFHYSAVLMPIVFLAAVDGLARSRGVRLTRAATAGAVVAAAVSVVILVPQQQHPSWTANQRTATDQLLDRIPDGATVAATNRLAPRLTGRCEVVLYPHQPSRELRPEWIVDTAEPASWPDPPEEQRAHLAQLAATDYVTVARTDTVVLLRHRPPGSGPSGTRP